METSTTRSVTTHTGSLLRPVCVVGEDSASDELGEAVSEVVRAQLEAGLDGVNDGEASEVSYATQHPAGSGGDQPRRHRPGPAVTAHGTESGKRSA